MAEIFLFRLVCVTTIGVCVFRCADFGCAPFLYADGGYMNKNIQEKIMDITGIELTPGNPTVCLGNGEQGFECCCDECDYFLLCFPEFDVQIKEKNIAASKDNTTK
ncbi:MAG: hypothetical protein IKB38_10385 [Clostridia bacterium]|nr:hypothetical protein [Clostridia bacterium]